MVKVNAALLFISLPAVFLWTSGWHPYKLYTKIPMVHNGWKPTKWHRMIWTDNSTFLHFAPLCLHFDRRSVSLNLSKQYVKSRRLPLFLLIKKLQNLRGNFIRILFTLLLQLPEQNFAGTFSLTHIKLFYPESDLLL